MEKQEVSAPGTEQAVLFGMEPIEALADDQLGVSHYVKGLAEVLLKLKPGSVVAVFGDWGQGKTSFLLMLKDCLKQNHDRLDHVETVWIPIWKYERTSDVVYSFTRDVAKQRLGFIGRVLRRIKVRGEEVWSALSIIIRSIKLKLPNMGEVDIKTTSKEMQKMAEAIRRKNWLAYEEEEKFRDALAKFLKSSGNVVVFIDDLDRCRPETALSIVEDLKLLLACTCCRFVLAVDPVVLRQAVAARYKVRGFEDPEQQALCYVDKLIDLSIPLPRMTIEDTRRFLDKLSERYPEFTALNKAEEHTLLAGTPLNPRSIKRLLASLYYEKRCKENSQR